MAKKYKAAKSSQDEELIKGVDDQKLLAMLQEANTEQEIKPDQPSEVGKQSQKTNNKKTIFDIFAKHHSDIVSNLERLSDDLLFLKNGINLVIGESKAGKTYTTIKSLIDKGFKNNIIHIDFDRNADKKLKDLAVQTFHINNAKEFLEDLSAEENDVIVDSLKEKILIIDSLQDLSFDEGLDSNSAALATMQRTQGFKDTGATIIVIHHTTLEGKTMKVKGNATVITSKSDTTITFIKKDKTTRIMEVMNTRAEDKIPSGTKIEFTNEKMKYSGEETECPR